MNDRQWAGPKGRGEPFGVGIEPRQRPRRGRIGDVGDKRIEGRPALGGVESRHGLAVGGVGAEPVHRLGRERDEAAGRKAARRLGDGGIIGVQDAGREQGCHCGTIVPK